MSKFTTEIRYICETASGLTESKGYNDIESIISASRTNIFNFSYPIFDENYKSVLESKILKHYYTREISEETVGLWKLRLNSKLNEIMPYYNKLYNSELIEFNPLYSTNVTRDKTGQVNGENESNGTTSATSNSTLTGSVTENGSANTDGSSTAKSTSENSGSGTNKNTNMDVYSDTPQGSLSNLENLTYLTNARKVTDNGETSKSSKGSNKTETTTSNVTTTENTTATQNANESENNIENSSASNFSNTEQYLEHVYGYENKDISELLMKYRKSFLNIDMMIIEELEPLFFQLW